MLRPLPTASLFATWLLLAGPGFAQAPGERERGDAEREGAAEAEEREGAARPMPPRLLEAPAVEVAEPRPPRALEVTIGADGSVAALHLPEGDADRALLEAGLGAWRFEPAQRGGEAIPARVRVEVRFAVAGAEAEAETEAEARAPARAEAEAEAGAEAARAPAEARAPGGAEAEAEAEAGAPAEARAPAEAEAPAEARAPAEAEAGAPAPAEAGAPDPAEARAQREGAEDDADAEADGPSFGAAVQVQLEALRSEERATSDVEVERDVLQAAPHAEGADILRTAPGLYLARAAGDATGHRIMLRGFDAEHGQDIAVSLMGLPLNQPSHIHGQGYLDLGFLIPEVVSSLRVTEGVYDPTQGDFAVAGSVDLRLGVARRGVTAKVGYGSFGTLRVLGLWAPEDARDETFAAVQFRRSDGFGQNRGGMNGSALVQYGFGSGPWRYRLLGMLHGSRYDAAGVLRRDDVERGRVGFYDVYPDATATAQNGFAARALLGFEATHRSASGANGAVGLWLGFDDFRIQQNFTGYTERSMFEPDWVGRGDLIEQQNRTTSLGLHARHRTAPYRPASWLEGTLELGVQARLDQIDQAQNLIQAPQNETWDQRVDARVRGLDLGAYLDLDWTLAEVLTLRGGVRADLLYYDIDDRLGNFIPRFRRDSFIVGFRRSAAGVAVGPRASAVVEPIEGLSFTLAYGEGYRSPQARTLEDGEDAPFTKVRSADLGARWRLDEHLDLRLAGYWTKLDDDVAFEPREGRLERIGPSRRLGGVLYALARPIEGVTAAVSVTYVDAELLEPPPASAEDPQPAYDEGQSLPYVPPWVVRADVGGERELVDLGAHALRGRVGAGYTFLSPRPLPFGEEAAPIHLLDASASVGWGPVAVGLEIYNLLDRRYAALELTYPSYWDRSAPRSRLPHRHTAAGAPRTLMATLEVTL
ncbi:MAG: TonB-dependent receptor [Sandaracinus sp.]|nr:TonB-dependent receptor [Myxococcales bacterium]MAT26378.1 TonB-dependent receptor [Sandaracinus sp.]MBJ70140.1 TonB-dependent receptor [Sandaracinus sp.]